jgi:hypothetical protein
MIKRILTTIIVFTGFFSPAFPQTKTTSNTEQVWLGYFNQTRFSKRWGLWADVHLRTKENFVEDLSQGIVRVGATYYLNDAAKLTAGYAFVNHFPADNHKNISMPEHRLWQQLQWHTSYKKARTMQWLRLEQRWRHKIENDDKLADGYNFNWRIRYNFFYQFPLTKKQFSKGGVSFVVNDEIHVNFGKSIVYNYFDQNRFFVGFAYQTTAHSNLQLGYMNIFQQLAAGNQYKIAHVIRLFYFQNIDFRKSKG